LQEDKVIAATRCWVERFVVDLNLCPFARRELEQGGLRFSVTSAADEAQLLQALQHEIDLLLADSAIETTLLIHPAALPDFYDYNQFLGECERLLHALDLEGVLQVASFHPQYQFAGTAADAAENYSNRSPYPMLHVLREESVARAVAAHPDVDGIPARNIATLNTRGAAQLLAMRQACCDD
jgi:hypothetical protein